MKRHRVGKGKRAPGFSAYYAAMDADEAYGAELRRLFGKRAGDVRYTAKGNGEPGSRLRALYHAKLEADRVLEGGGL